MTGSADLHAPTTAQRVLRAATVGTFDGVHRGHRRVIDTLKREAEAVGLQPAVITFLRHPLEVIAPQRAPKEIVTVREKCRLLSMEGVEVLPLDFDTRMMNLSAREWMVHMRDDMGVRLIVVGHDNTFGTDGRSLSPADYVNLGDSLGIKTIVAPVVEGCSSSLARRAIAAGDMEEAARILGRPYSLTGTIVTGDRLGRTIGYPTANLSICQPEQRLLPPFGAYLTAASLEEGALIPAITNIGVRPSVSCEKELRIETHLLDFDDDIYGHQLTIRLLTRLRPERRFAGLTELKAAIAADEREARRIYADSIKTPNQNTIFTPDYENR